MKYLVLVFPVFPVLQCVRSAPSVSVTQAHSVSHSRMEESNTYSDGNCYVFEIMCWNFGKMLE